MTIWVDADACPRHALAITRETAEKYGIDMWTVSNYNHEFTHERHLTVDASPQAADLAILSRLSRGDIVITQDYGLAALVLVRGGHAVSPIGKRYTNDNIDQMLFERDLAARARRSRKTVRMKGPPPRTGEDDRQFADQLERLLAELNPHMEN